MPTPLDAAALRRWCVACIASLQEHRAEIDAMNVFPVPDSDTGTNLWLTMQGAQAGLDTGGPDDAPGTVTGRLAEGALRAAQGNSGVILSQLLLGLAEVWATAPGALSGRDLARGLGRAADLAWTAVARPVEGTMLSVARAAAAGAAATMDDEPGAGPARIAVAAARAAGEALAQTPGQLPPLARACVVDAGGRGLVLLLDELAAVLADGSPAAPAAVVAQPVGTVPPPLAAAPEPPVGPGPEYEVQYLLEATDPAAQALRRRLSELGDSVVVAGSGGAGLWRVHVHTDHPAQAIEAGVRAGAAQQIAMTRFSLAERQAGQAPSGAERRVLTVGPDAGLAGLFAGVGIALCPVDAAAVLAAIQAPEVAQAVVLACGPEANAIAAEAARRARDGGREVGVVPIRSAVQGLAAAAVADGARLFGDDVVAMAEAAAATRWGELVVAEHDAITMAGFCRAGDVLGVVEDDVLVVGVTVSDVATELLDRLLSGGGDLVTLVTGADAPPALSADLIDHLHRRHPTVEVQALDGAPVGWPLLFGVE